MWNRFITQCNDHIVKVSYTMGDTEPASSRLIAEEFRKEPARDCFVAKENGIDFVYRDQVILRQIDISLREKEVERCYVDGAPDFRTKQTANGEVTYIANAKRQFERNSWEGQVVFQIGESEKLLGLGQYEDGIFDYRNHTEYLYQSNMRIAMPVIVTTGHYAIFIDSESDMIFESRDQSITFSIDTTQELTYYILFGEDVSQLVGGLQELTGRASMLPRWVYGYVQSKERYQSAKELQEIVERFRREQIPIDGIVQDWFTWEDGLWGEKILDKKRFPDFPDTVDKLHAMHTHVMVSIWPNMSPDGTNYREFMEAGGLLPNSNVYNAFEEEFRSLYWKQCEKEIMAADVDALWCDNAEPFSDADWSGESRRPERQRYDRVVESSKQFMRWEQVNSYGLYHARGIYENWRRTIPDKRVVNLTRSSYLSGQQYGTILWSGDICARWDTLRKQIVEGLKMGLCANPYWTLDIGGFFTVKDKYENRGCGSQSTEPLWFWNGDFNDGVNDPGYRELYTRWLQFGTFLPIFRSHGSDTPREPWQFISRNGEELACYETIVKFIRLRYKLMPYIYSLAYRAHKDAYIMMRSLVFDYGQDEKALEITDEYMFGDAFLVAPVCQPMYYGPNGEKLSGIPKYREVYLPKGNGWYDYWSHTYYEGGQTILAEAPLEVMPLFVKAGAIIPCSAPISYADQKSGEVEELLVFTGADGHFVLYNDAGDGYGFEQGEYTLLQLDYSETDHQVRINQVSGDRKLNQEFTITYIRP